MRILNVYTICIILLAATMFSCSDMNDLHEKYMADGETIYAAKVDSVIPCAGNNRMLLKLFVGTQKVESVRIFWNDYHDSVDVAISGKTGKFEKLLEKLDERSYVFQFVSFDKFGNRSLPFELSCEVLGENYANSLLTRKASALQTADGVLVKFASAPEDNISTVITYPNTEGKLTSLNIPSSENSHFISDSNPDCEFSFSSSYSPPGAIDIFYSSSYSLKAGYAYKFDVKEMSVIDYSTQHSDGDNAASNMISGRYDVRWHTTAGGSSFPHYVTIDLGAMRTVTKSGVWRSVYDVGDKAGDDRAPDKIQFLVSKDKQSWTDLGTYDFNRFINDEQFYEFQPTDARYLKLIGLSGPEDYMVLGGINIFGF